MSPAPTGFAPVTDRTRETAATPRVSVVIIFLDAAKYLREAVESVFAQTYTDWALLLVDDGSTDCSTTIARDHAAARPGQVLCLEHDGHANRGMSASRNLGLAHARGEFVAFLDADDVWLPEKLARQVAILDQHPDVGLTIGPALYWHADDRREPQRMTLPPGRLPRGAWLPRILEDDDNAACPSAVLIRRGLALDLGGFEASFDGPFMMVEDQVMWFKAAVAAPVYHSPECLALYRIHPASCCRATPPEQHLRVRLRLYSWLAEFLAVAGRRHAPSPSLAVLARARLCDVLVQTAARTQDGRRRGRLARLGSSIALVRTHGRDLGLGFSLVLLLGGVWARAAAAVSRRRFGRALAALARTASVWEGEAPAEPLPPARQEPRPPKRRLYPLLQWVPTGVRRLAPEPAKRLVRRLRTAYRRTRARLGLGVGVEPYSYIWGSDRGLALCRHYLEQFLAGHAADVRGHCLEFQEDFYTTRFGGPAVTRLDILHADESNLRATLVADLTRPNDLPADRFDCVICTHVLHVIAELDRAVAGLHRILKPGGVLLVAVPCVSMCDPKWHELWRFTEEGLHVVLSRAFGADQVTTRAYGNSLTAAGQIRGLATHEFTPAELDRHDPRFAVEVCARACKTS